MKQIITFIIALLFLLSSCRPQEEKENVIDIEFGNTPTTLSDSLRTIGEKTQNIEIDPTIDNTILGNQGTLILILAHSLIDGQGKPITSRANIQLKECYTLKDMVTNHLQTVNNEDILQTEGMIYLTATTADGTKVGIEKSKPIHIEMPISPNITAAKFFKGRRDENGHMNWDRIEEPDKKLVPFPIKMLAPLPGFECPPDFGFTQDPNIWKDTLAKYYYTNDDITKYENTLLATREFKARYDHHMMADLTAIYLANLDKNMWEVDELMVQHFIKDSTERVSFELNNTPPGPNGGKRTKEQEKAHQWLVNQAKQYGHRRVETYKKFAAQKLTKVDERLKLDTSKVNAFNKAFLTYEAVEFGWINCDVLYRDPKAEKVKLFVQTNEQPAIINLIFRSRKIVLDGTSIGENKFQFTKDVEGYNKLPKGDTAIILAIGYRSNQITFDSKEIIIGKNEIEKLELKVVTVEELKRRLP